MFGKLKIVALILLIPSISHADNFSVEKIGKHTLQIQKLRKREKFSFDHEISSYEVNCAKTIIAVWGEWHPYKKFHLQDRIAVKISVLDINANRVLGDFTVTRGPYRIQYKKNERAILVDAEDLVKFRNKKIEIANVSSGNGNSFELEDCADFPYKFLNRIDDNGNLIESPHPLKPKIQRP